MITSSSRDRGFQANKEGDGNESNKVPKAAAAASTSSRQWSAFSNPRIVRVSRSFGGKDRHSKVCTIRGLRDRRIRLSVPTAIQLYDLQDRLGLKQPSKVIDWLLDATKHDIDKLPPLQFPHGFGQFHQSPPMLLSHHDSTASHQPSFAPSFDANPTFLKGFHSSLGIKINRSSLDEEDQNAIGRSSSSSSSKDWDIDASLRAKSKEVEGDDSEKGEWIKTNNLQENHKFFPLASSAAGGPSSLPGGLVNTSPTPFNSYYHWDGSNLSLSQFGGHGFRPQTEGSLNINNNNAVSLPSSLALSSGSQLFLCPPTSIPSLFPPYPPYIAAAPRVEGDSREINHFQLLSSSSQLILPSSLTMSPQLKPFPLNANSGLVHSQRENKNHLDKDNADS